ncbi:MAG TPA: tetratricopeptide repeat protein [Candidatus Polarisedimenticolia bacterium]
MTSLILMILAPIVSTVAPAASPAEARIQQARASIESGAADAKSLNRLAVALTRRARETGDPSYYDRAIAALAEAGRIEPGNPETTRVSAWTRMGRHEFSEAFEITRRYAASHPDDDVNLGVMGDALMELGRYDEAAVAYQRMLDLRPGPASYSRAAYLREVTGDLEGSLDLMRMALQATDRRETEDRAWLLVQIGHLHEVMGEESRAETTYRAALDSFPGYHYALTALADLALRRGLAAGAETLARDAIKAAPHAERYLLLADALRCQGRGKEADAAEKLFETLASANIAKNDNENHDLVLYYLERRPDLKRALEIARMEARRRRDVHTLDRLALALHRSGRTRRARRLAERILAVGTRDPLIASHAREIIN